MIARSLVKFLEQAQGFEQNSFGVNALTLAVNVGFGTLSHEGFTKGRVLTDLQFGELDLKVENLNLEATKLHYESGSVVTDNLVLTSIAEESYHTAHGFDVGLSTSLLPDLRVQDESAHTKALKHQLNLGHALGQRQDG